MDPLTSVARWFWILFVLVNMVNYVIAGQRARRLAGDDPQRQAWYARILRVYYGALCIPFLIMGVGIVFGCVPTVFHYFRPQDGNPYVLLFFAANIVLSVLAAYLLVVGIAAIVMLTRLDFPVDECFR
ncbi:MAG: hypothetical protein R2856_20790 [Caldilineaceae bacterium]